MSTEETKDFVKSLMGGYTEEALQAAFNEVKNPDDWKAPIKTIVKGKTSEELECIKFAVRFYTGTPADAKPVADYEYEITATGYRMGPAGP